MFFCGTDTQTTFVTSHRLIAYGTLDLELCYCIQLPTLAHLVKPRERAKAGGAHDREPLVGAAARAATVRDVQLEPSLAAGQ